MTNDRPDMGWHASGPISAPARETLDESERQAYDFILARERRKFATHQTDDRQFEVSVLYRVLLQSPLMAEAIARLTNFFMQGETRGTYTNRQRELVDLALAVELRTTFTAFTHVADAMGVGIDPDSIKNVLDGRLDRLTEDDAMVVQYARAVCRGQVAPGAFEELANTMGLKGAVEYTELICCKMMLMRTLQVFIPLFHIHEDWETDLERLHSRLERLRAGEDDVPDYHRGDSWTNTEGTVEA